MEKYKVIFESLPWESPNKGVRYKVHQEGGRQLRLVEFTREFFETDWCSKGHIGYVMDGTGELDFNGLKILYSTGDGIFIQPGIQSKHKLRVTSDVIRLILVEECGGESKLPPTLN